MTFTFGIEYPRRIHRVLLPWEPTWSPDGSQLAFTGYRAAFGYEVHIAAVG